MLSSLPLKFDQLFGLAIASTDKLHRDALLAFARGVEKRKLPFRIFDIQSGYQPCDILVTFGVDKRKTSRGRAVGEIISTHQEAVGVGRHLVVERGFIHRDRYFMVGWGGLNGRADFCNANCHGDRFRQLAIRVAPWRTTGKNIVLCGQIPWDAAVQHTDHNAWCRNTAAGLAKLSNRPIIFRPHPLQPDAVDMTSIPVVISQNATLEGDLEDAWAVVTFNSNAGVEATLAGVPAFAADIGAMGYAILNKDFKHIESPAMPDRKQWLFNLAYAQWTLDEIADGKALVHLWEKRFATYQRFLRSAQNTTSDLRSLLRTSFTKRTAGSGVA